MCTITLPLHKKFYMSPLCLTTQKVTFLAFFVEFSFLAKIIQLGAYSSGVCEVVVTNSLDSDTEETDHSLNELAVSSHSLEKFAFLDFYTEPDDNPTDYCALYGRQ